MSEPWPIQQLGSTGEDVRTVQYLAAFHGHPVVVDGKFGVATRAAVQAVQTSKGLIADGIVGDLTWQALIVPVVAGTSGVQVRAVQGQLASQGWRVAVDGVFGPQTIRSVRDFQAAHGLPVTGLADPTMWNVMVAGFFRLGSPVLASAHLYDAWGADDRRTALKNATQAAVDLLLRGSRGTLTTMGCSPDETLGAGHFVCSYTYEGGAVSLQVVGNAADGYYVESASFIVD